MKTFLKSAFASAIFVASTLTSSVYAQDFSGIKIMTEEYPPFNYTENGQPAGTAVDLLLKATEAVGSPINKRQITVAKWARAYKTVAEGTNAMLFSAARTEDRESSFKWAGPIDEIRTVMFAKKSAGIGKIDDIANIKYKVGVVRDDVGDSLAKAAGVPESMITRNSGSEAMAKMLAGGRIDVWAYPEVAAIDFLEKAGENMDDYEVVYVLKSTKLYYAFSKDTDDSIVAKLQKGIDMVK